MSEGLRERAGALCFVGIPGPSLDAHTRADLERLRVGGVVLFRRNLGTPSEIAALTAELHALPSRPLVAIDHEGGRVLRVAAPFTRFPPAAAVGAAGDAALARRVGRAMAAELAAVGIDLSFAPVLDVHSNPANPVIGDRSFGSDAEAVGRMGVALMRGLRDGGVIPCGKHFPGHGDTDVDSHLALPVVRRSRQQLERTELVPFRAAIAAGIPALMTAHVVYTELDPDRPATLSAEVMEGLLRRRLGFGGVLFSDDLDMGAIVAHSSVGGAAVAALAAGVDAVLVCQHFAHAVEAVEDVQRAIRDGELGKQRLAAALTRVRSLRRSRRRRATVDCALPNAAHLALVERILGV